MVALVVLTSCALCGGQVARIPLPRRLEPADRPSGPVLVQPGMPFRLRPRTAALLVAALLGASGVLLRSPLLAGPGVVVAASAGVVAEAGLHRRRGRSRRRDVVGLVDRLSRSVRSGATLIGALVEAGRDEGLGNLSDELAGVRAEVSAGRPLAVALDAWSLRASDPDLRLLAGTVSVLAAAGGSAGPAIDAVAAAIRARVAAEEEVRAQAAQARASVALLVGAPVAFALVLAVVDPRLGQFLVHRPAGALCVSVGLALDSVALWWMQRIIEGATA